MIGHNQYSKVSLEKDFWLFYVDVYSHAGIEEACSCLQSKYQLNINFLLFCCFSAKENYCGLSSSEINLILTSIIPWNQKIVEAFDKLLKIIPRQTKHTEIIRFRELAAENEVLAKKIEQSLMLQAIEPLLKKEKNQNKTNIALNNVFNYLNSQHINLHKTDLEKIYRLVKTSFSG